VSGIKKRRKTMSTMEQIKSVLSSEEPDYKGGGKHLDRKALGYLRRIVTKGDPMTASKAVYLASLVRGAQSEGVVLKALRNPERVVRVAAAGASRNLPPEARNAVLLALLGDGDSGVRRVALKSVPAHPSAKLRAKVYRLSRESPDLAIRRLAASVMQHLSVEA